MEDSDIDWTLFLGREPGVLDPEIIEEFIRGRRVMITGAGGSIGSAVARRLSSAGVDRLVLLDIAEHGLFELSAALEEEAGGTRNELIVGDVCDRAMLQEIFARHRPHVVFHAAACKHVALMESNPFSAARSNIIGTHRLLQTAREAGVGQVIVISTDKAVDPAGIMGATKRVAELLVMASTGATQVKAVRLANVLGSSGSVAPTFLRQIARGGPVTITDPACSRYFLSMDEAVRHLVSALASDSSSTVLVPEIGEAFSITELAQFLIEQVSRDMGEVEIVYTGLRAGEKLTERMIARDESFHSSNLPPLQRAVHYHPVSASTLDLAIEEIEKATEERNLDQLLTAILAIVPAYEPSRQMQKQAEREAKMVW